MKQSTAVFTFLIFLCLGFLLPEIGFQAGLHAKTTTGSCTTLSFIPGKRIFFTPPEGGRYFAVFLADAGANPDNPGINGARLDQICVFGASIFLGPDGHLHTSPVPPNNGIQIPPIQITVPSAQWRLPTDFECSELQ